MNNRSRATLFLMEQSVVIIVFAVCAAVCAAILANSYLLADRSNDMSNALRAAENAAECFKAASGDAEQALAILGADKSDSGAANVYYDKNWQICAGNAASYVLAFTNLEAESSSSPIVCEISVRAADGAEIIALTVAARRKTI